MAALYSDLTSTSTTGAFTLETGKTYRIATSEGWATTSHSQIATSQPYFDSPVIREEDLGSKTVCGRRFLRDAILAARTRVERRQWWRAFRPVRQRIKAVVRRLRVRCRSPPE
jgi:hypothetical protein